MALPQQHTTSTLGDVIRYVLELVYPITGIVAAMALLVFFWGLAKFIFKAGDAKSHGDGKNLMIWGLIALFVMMSVFGIVKFFYNDLGFDKNPSHGTFGIPKLPTE